MIHSGLYFSVFNPGIQRDTVTAFCHKQVDYFLSPPQLLLHFLNHWDPPAITLSPLSSSSWDRTGKTPTAVSLRNKEWERHKPFQLGGESGTRIDLKWFNPKLIILVKSLMFGIPHCILLNYSSLRKKHHIFLLTKVEL